MLDTRCSMLDFSSDPKNPYPYPQPILASEQKQTDVIPRSEATRNLGGGLPNVSAPHPPAGAETPAYREIIPENSVLIPLSS